MGYHTDYTLEIRDQDEATVKRLIAELRDFSPDAGDALDEDGGCSGECVKWYECESDMREFSAKHPDVLFVLGGDGESRRDIWTKYFKGGKCQDALAKIDFEEFSTEKLS